MPNLSQEDITSSLRKFKSRRDSLLHEDVSTFDHHLTRFLQFCDEDPLITRVLEPIEEQSDVDIEAWWDEYTQSGGNLGFPSGEEEEMLLRLRLLQKMEGDRDTVFRFGVVQSVSKYKKSVQLVRSLIIRPLAAELSSRIGDEANIASPEAREVQAVPYERIPATDTTRIFLSHKSVDKAIVRRYYDALAKLGFNPWLDAEDLPAGKKLDRGIFQGFEESCAAVFFITENFVDADFLEDEIDYAKHQEREKGDKFSIITLQYPGATTVPDLLKPYTYKTVSNDLEGFYEVVRALPVELGQERWKEPVV
jgi:hypothetical protein